MEHKLPYYMAYPMDLKEYGEEKRDRRDVEYMKSMYPMSAKKILPYVEEECDRMEYEGSMIYDEYPDRLLLYLMAGRIYDSLNGRKRTGKRLSWIWSRFFCIRKLCKEDVGIAEIAGIIIKFFVRIQGLRKV